MAVVIYKNGKKMICAPFSLDSMLNAGWSLTEKDELPSEKEIPEDMAGVHLLDAVRKDDNKMTEEEIRQQAKAAGIKHWWNKNLDVLLEELTA